MADAPQTPHSGVRWQESELARRFWQGRQGAVVAGVCAELARRIDGNVWVIRGLWLLVGWFSLKLALLPYLVLALLLPLKGEPRPASSSIPRDWRDEGRSERLQRLEAEFEELERKIRS